MPATRVFRMPATGAARRALAVLLGVVVGLASPCVTGVAVAGPATAPEEPTARTGAGGDPFRDCPTRAELPEGAEPAEWRCEVMGATGHLTVGRIDVAIDEPIVVTHAEGRIDGEFHQVFGGMRAQPIRVPFTPLTITPRYGGSFDFHTNEERVGELDMTFRVSGPALSRACSLGTVSDPVSLILQAAGEKVPGELPDLEDMRFEVPGSSGCGPVGGLLLDTVWELPSPSGRNGIFLDGDRVMRSYTDLPAWR